MNILRLKDILKEKGITGKELAEKVGVSQPAISDIVKGKSFPRPELLLQIAETLNVDIKDLFHSTKETKTIHVIIDNKLHTFNDIKEFKYFANNQE